MTRNTSVALRVFVCLIAGCLPVFTALAQEDAPVSEYAERVPLAPQSLILDVIRSGDRIIAVGERGHIIFSDDDGVSWTQAASVPTRATLTTIAAADGQLWAAGHDSVILTSSDGGDNWTEQYLDPERQQPIMDLYFSDVDNGIAIGAYGFMMLTHDGGDYWEDWAVNDEDDMHLNAIIESPQGSLLIAGEAGFSYRSTDGGETWESLELPYAGSMFGAVTTGADCVMFFGLRGHAMLTCDDGDSWEELTTGTMATLLGGVSQGDQVLLAGNSGNILRYKQATGFSTDVHSSGVDFSAAISLGPGQYLLVGEDGAHFYPESSEGGVAQ